ncbi:MAG: hypothetical protein ACREPB_10175 [Arenimonas sp.]
MKFRFLQSIDDSPTQWDVDLYEKYYSKNKHKFTEEARDLADPTRYDFGKQSLNKSRLIDFSCSLNSRAEVSPGMQVDIRILNRYSNVEFLLTYFDVAVFESENLVLRGAPWICTHELTLLKSHWIRHAWSMMNGSQALIVARNINFKARDVSVTPGRT